MTQLKGSFWFGILTQTVSKGETAPPHNGMCVRVCACAHNTDVCAGILVISRWNQQKQSLRSVRCLCGQNSLLFLIGNDTTFMCTDLQYQNVIAFKQSSFEACGP